MLVVKYTKYNFLKTKVLNYVKYFIFYLDAIDFFSNFTTENKMTTSKHHDSSYL